MSAIQFLSSQAWVEQLGWTLVHFLWQGAAIAALYGVARTWLGRTRSAQFRYALACAALAAMAAAPIVTLSLTGVPNSTRGDMVAGAARVFPAPASASSVSIALPVLPSRGLGENVMPWLVIAWFGGATLFWLRLVAGWAIAARMRSTLVRPAPPEWQERLDQIKERIRIARPVCLMVSGLVQVPTVVGWLRPMVLTPVGALTGLPPEHVEALLAHELAHISRRDYLVNILQSVAEAFLFYHPGVWWISGDIRSERELCCDDVAVAISGDALTYARALADLESYRPERLNTALAANGGSLKDRVARLLGVSQEASRSLPGPGVIVSATLLAAACCLLVQSTPASEFEVASVKVVKPPFELSYRKLAHGKLDFKAASLADCIVAVYGINRLQIVGPDWLNQERYDILATAPEGTSNRQLMPMLEKLLADRFRMKVHREIRNLAVYALTLGKNGPKLKLSAADSAHSIIPIRGTPNGWRLTHTSIPKFVDFLTSYGAQRDGTLDRLVVDQTGVLGDFDFEFVWTPERGQPIDDETPSPSIFTAVQTQLGLKLEAKKGPVEVIVIDHAEKIPTEN